MTYTSWTVRTLAVPSAIWLAFACGFAAHTLDPLFTMLTLGMRPLVLLWTVVWLFASAMGKERLPVTQSDGTLKAQLSANAAPATSPAGAARRIARSTTATTTARTATPVWRRYAARTLDLLLWTFLATYAVAFINTVTGWHLLQFRSTLMVNMSFLGMIYLPLALFLDAVVYAACGNSIGKALLGIRVVEPDGVAPSFGRYLARNFSVWARGFAFGLPVAQQLVMLLNVVLLKRDGITAWDARLKFRVVREPCAAVHYLLAVLFAALLVSAAAYHRTMHRSADGMTPAANMQPEAARARLATAETLETVAPVKKL